MKITSTAATLSAALALLMIGTATASGAPDRLTDPGNPGIAVPAAQYESAFSGYQPFQAQTSDAWKQLNKTVAEHPGMASMAGIKRDAPPITGSPAEGGKASGEHDMHAMHDMPEKTAAAMEPQLAVERDKTRPPTAPPQPAAEQTAGISGTGIVQGIDKANGTVKLAHEPIAALGWPNMTMLFRLKNSGLADQVKVGDQVEFSLEKASSGYVISAFHKGVARHDMNETK